MTGRVELAAAGTVAPVRAPPSPYPPLPSAPPEFGDQLPPGGDERRRRGAAAIRRVSNPVPAVRRAAVVVGTHLLVIVVFSLPAVILWWHAWDGRLGTTLTCACGDAGQQVWFVAWPAYALAHGLNPFFSTALYAPQGVNLLTNTSSPLVGVLLAPVTWLAGPIVATNLALTLAPALSGWAAWLAARRFIGEQGWRPAAWLAGLLFGYSPFVVDNIATGHVMLALLVVPPLVAMVLYDLLGGRGSPVRQGVALGVLACVQCLISLEVLTILALGVLLVLVLAVLAAPRVAAARARPLALGLGTAAVTGAVLTALPAWFALDGPRHIDGSPWPGIAIQGNRLFDLWDPGAYSAPANSLLKLGGYEGLAGPPGVYLGLGVLALAAVGLWAAWHRRAAWVLAGCAVVTFVLSLGLLLWTSSTSTAAAHIWLPWQWLARLPLLGQVAPQRVTVLTDLCVAVLVAGGLDALWHRLAGRAGSKHPQHGPNRLRAVNSLLLGAGLLALVPVWITYQLPLATSTVSMPRWFATAGRHLPEGTVVLSYPFPFPTAGTSAPMVWQSEDGMRFRLAGGYAKAPSASGAPLTTRPQGTASALLAALSEPSAGALPTGTAHQVAVLRGALDRWQVGDVVVTDGGRDPGLAAALFTAVLDRSPTRTENAWVWRIDRTSTGDLGEKPATAAVILAHCRGAEPTPAAGAPPGSALIGCVAAGLGVPGPPPAATG